MIKRFWKKALLCAVIVSSFKFQVSLAPAMAQSQPFSLADWKGLTADTVLKLNVSEYKLDYNHPLPYADMQKQWTVKAELQCGTLGTEQVFVCKEGKASHLIGKNSLHGDISLGYDNTAGRFFVEVLDRDENPHRLWAGPRVEAGQWYQVCATAQYDVKTDESVLQLTVNEDNEQLRYPGKALRHNASLWVIGHGFPGGFPNALQVRGGAIRNLEISGEPLPRVAGQNPLFTDCFTADPAFTVVGNTVYAYVGEDQAAPGGWFNMPHWLCYSSTDMKHWTAHGPVLKSEAFPYATPGSAWAAQVVEKDGKFYFYVTVDRKDKREHAIDVAVSDSPTGPFLPARKDGTPLITDGMTRDSHRRNADIDPTVLIDDDGTPWMAWGNGDCYMVRLKRNMIELDGEIRKVPLRNYSEGPWLFKRGSIYYNVYASDAPDVQPEQIAYSMAPSIEGPWTYGGFVSTSANHGFTIHPSVIQFQGEWYYIYHDGSYNLAGAPGGDCRRSVCAEYLHFNADGTIQFVPLTQEGLSSRVPPLTPAWMLGHIAWEDNRNTQEATLELIRQYREHEIPVDGVFIDSPWSMSYNDFIWDKQRYPDAEAMAAQLKEWGVKPILWQTSNVNLTSDGVPQNKCDDYDEMLRLGYAINGGQPSKWWKGTGLQTDFTNPKAKEWFYNRLDRAFTDSFYGFKVDQGEVYFGDTVTTSIGRMPNEQFRQYYYDAMYDYVTTRKPGVGGIVARPYSHQGGRHAGVQKMSMGWCGDFGGDWKGLKLQIDNIYRSAQMGFGAVGTEIAGFMGAKSSKQHFIRYAQFGALTACMINGGENGGWTNHLPWWHDAETTDIYRDCVTLHRELVPYIFSNVVDTHFSGGTLMPQTSLQEESHLLGRDLFTKAITSDNNEESFHLPTEGEWLDYWTGERHAGGTALTQTYSLNRFPLFVRAGAIIPVNREGQRTFIIHPDGLSSRQFHLPVGEGTDYFDCQVTCDAKTRRITLTSDVPADWVFIVKGKRAKRLTATGKSVNLKY